MATTSNVSFTTPFTKAFLAKHNSFAARVEFRFDCVSHSLTLLRVNYWKNKDVVHLDTPLADDPLIPQGEILPLYQQASMIAVEWSRKFPLEKLSDNTYKTSSWKPTLVFYANSIEEAFLYWMLYDLYPQVHMVSLNEFIMMNMKPTQQQLKDLQAHEQTFQNLISKMNAQLPFTPEEEAFLENSKSTISFTKGPKGNVENLLKIHAEIAKVQFPQKLDSESNIFSLQTIIESKQGPALVDKNNFYVKTLQKLPNKKKENTTTNIEKKSITKEENKKTETNIYEMD